MANTLTVLLVGAGLGLGGVWIYGERSGNIDNAAMRSEPLPLVVPQQSYPLCSSAIRRNCVVDGDTFYTARDKIRIADIDTPETHPPHCAEEADLGDRATNRLSELLSAGAFELVSVGRDEDRYGRKLRVIIRNGRSIGDILVGEGLARTWTGRRQPWCRGNDESFG
jgi:micrococcal nuclease